MASPMTAERAGKPAEQLTFDLDRAPSLARRDFLESESNAAALRLVEAWPDWPHPVAAIIGPPGSGKSHLGRIWAARTGAETLDPGDPLVRGAFVLEYELSGKVLTPEAETALFHALNRAAAGEGDILILSGDPPARWPVALPDLKTRLAAVPVTRLDVPDTPLMGGVLLKLFIDRQLRIAPEVVPFLAARLERSLARAGEAVEALDRAALAAKRPVTVAFAAKVLGLRRDATGDGGAGNEDE